MENTNKFRQLMYEDSELKAETRTELARAKTALQELLDEWNNKLGMSRISDYAKLFSLIHTPEKTYSAAVREASPVPVDPGLLEIRPGVSIRLPDIPTPNTLFVLARTARNAILTGHVRLWSISADGKIVLNEDEAEIFLNASDIYASRELSKKYATACVQLKENMDTVIDIMSNMTSSRLPLSPFSIAEQTGFAFLYRLKLEPDQLREQIRILETEVV
jgi:hypothetical protein